MRKRRHILTQHIIGHLLIRFQQLRKKTSPAAAQFWPGRRVASRPRGQSPIGGHRGAENYPIRHDIRIAGIVAAAKAGPRGGPAAAPRRTIAAAGAEPARADERRPEMVLALLHQLPPLLAQRPDHARAADHPLGTGRIQRPAAALRPLHQVRAQGRDAHVSERRPRKGLVSLPGHIEHDGAAEKTRTSTGCPASTSS